MTNSLPPLGDSGEMNRASRVGSPSRVAIVARHERRRHAGCMSIARSSQAEWFEATRLQEGLDAPRSEGKCWHSHARPQGRRGIAGGVDGLEPYFGVRTA